MVATLWVSSAQQAFGVPLHTSQAVASKHLFRSTAPVPPHLEGESMALLPVTGAAFADVAASGGEAVELWTDGSAVGVLSAPAGGTLTVRARAATCAGAAKLTVSVAGGPVADLEVAVSAWTTLRVGAWSGGSRSITATFTNDSNQNGCDRNVWIDMFEVQAKTPAHVAAAPKTFGISSPGVDGGVNNALATAAALRHHLDIINFYKQWVWRDDLPVGELNQIRAAGARPEITWEPWDPTKGAVQPKYSLTAIAHGRFDSYIKKWAAEAAAYGKQFMLRFGHEMNGTWYPWAPAATGASGSDYIAAYRHIHQLFAAAGAKNVTWVWSVNTVEGMTTKLSSVYPGDSYVDVIGIDGYNGGTDGHRYGGWKTPRQLFANTLFQLSMLSTKPEIVNETGSSEHGGNKAAWIKSLFGYLRTTPVSSVVWFDYDDTRKPDWRLRSSAKSLASAKRALQHW